jgi:hypothetical protein
MAEFRGNVLQLHRNSYPDEQLKSAVFWDVNIYSLEKFAVWEESIASMFMVEE